jgi:hypothetical protein
MIVHTYPLCTILIQKKITGAPQGDKLGHMYPFSCSSWICSLSSASCLADILCNLLYIGAVLGINSMMNLMSLLGGIPGNSSGNT